MNSTVSFKMKTKLYGFLILLSVVIIHAEPQKLCTNGVFKCVSPNSLRICLLDKLVTSEFFCPNSTFCNEKSPTICTKIPAALPAIQYFEESVTTDEDIYPSIPCTELGIFEVENTGCTTFLNCSNLEETEESTCDEVSLFNPETKSCNEDFICPENLDNIYTYDDCSETINTFICTKVGNFFLPNTNCEKYIHCEQIYIGLKAILKYCPKNSLFDPILGKCVKGHICEDKCTTTTPFQELSTTIITTTPEDSPKCPGPGRFPVPNTNCTVFRLCVNTVNGIVHQDFTCPSGSYFNPNTLKCSSKYECWPQVTSTVPSMTDGTTTQSTVTDDTTIQSTVTDNTTTQSTVTDDTTTQSTVTDDTTTQSTVTDDTTIQSTVTDDTTTQSTVTEPITIANTSATDDSTPNTADAEDTTTSSIITNSPITTPNTEAPDDSTPISTNAQDTTFSNPITTTQDSSLNTDLPTSTQETSTNSSNEPIPTTRDIPKNTDYTEETTTSSSTNDNEPSTPVIDCRNQGRLPVLNTKCKLYYQCTLTTNGYKYKTFECSEGTLFDPYKKICSGLYICPEIVLSTTTDKTITEPQESTTTDFSESSEEIAIELNCIKQGKVPVPNTNCVLYGKCTLTTNGFIQSIYECPKGSLYDPEMNLCSSSYICPETISVTTTEKDITTVPIELSTSFPTVSLSTTTEKNPLPIIPSCTEQGKFPILNTNCKSYLSCILTTSGFTPTEYVCSGNLLFDPNLKKCSSKYICKEATQFPKSQEMEYTKEDYVNELGTTSPKPEFGKCTESGKFPMPNSKCSQFIICASTANGLISKIYTCPINSFYDPGNKRCSQTYSCSELDITSSTEPPRTTGLDLDIPECRKNGKFPIYNSGCSKYILCTFTSTGFKSKEYTCPDDSFFNPDLKRCHREYICPESDYTTTTEIVGSGQTSEETTEETSEECINIDVLKEIQVCSTSGKFPVDGTNCKQYILCTKTSLGFRSKIYSCPNDSNFDPSKNKCTVSYSCTEKICGAKTVKLFKNPIVTNCNSPGKFSIKGTNCKKFKLCVWTPLGYTKTVYDCPEGTSFNQRLQLCSENYICPEDLIYNCTTIGLFKDSTDPTCQYYISCKANSDGIVRGERKICPNDYYFDPMIQKCSAYYMCKNKLSRAVGLIAPKFLVNGQCTTVGRYAIQGTFCKKYMYCADNGDGTLKGTQFTCPTTSVFNQAIQKCAATYICPDSVCWSLGPAPNLNSKDCTSYIECEEIWDPITGLTTGYSGRVVFCPLGQKYDPINRCCSSNYICRI